MNKRKNEELNQYLLNEEEFKKFAQDLGVDFRIRNFKRFTKWEE